MATLKSLVDETTNIKNELVECHANLKNNLSAKGVECSDNDKMSSLIDKVDNIKGFKIIPGDTYNVPGFTSISKDTYSTMYVVQDYKMTMGGNLKLQFSYNISTAYSNFNIPANITFTVNRGGEVYHTETNSIIITSKNSVELIYDKIEFEKDDTISFFIGFTNSSSGEYRLYGYFSKISFDLEGF